MIMVSPLPGKYELEVSGTGGLTPRQSTLPYGAYNARSQNPVRLASAHLHLLPHSLKGRKQCCSLTRVCVVHRRCPFFAFVFPFPIAHCSTKREESRFSLSEKAKKGKARQQLRHSLKPEHAGDGKKCLWHISCHIKEEWQ